MTTHDATLAPSSLLVSVLQRWRQLFGPIEPTPGDTAAAEASSVRALADTYRRSDPSFASDLYAAADRHERAFGAAAGR
jgi:hypothetical protein